MAIKNFTWIPFYKEFAKKLLEFGNDRKKLLDIINNNRENFHTYHLHDNGGTTDLFKDIDPFTVFGIFNRGIKDDSRIRITKLFKEILRISADTPSDFNSIPILNNLRSHFFGSRTNRQSNDIQNLWNLFEKVVNNENFEKEYDIVINQYIININITMGLYWINPEKYLAFDKNNRSYLKAKYQIDLPSKVPKYSQYMEILKDIKDNMNSKKIQEQSFTELSYSAFNANHTPGNKNTIQAWYDDITDTLRKHKNIVLYGAPGTGKTYDVPEFAVRLCDADFDDKKAGREDIIKRYKQLKQEKRIAFTTFHQSMDYEDWLEGLRPVINDNNQVTYEIEKGIFKKLCEEAERPVIKNNQAGIADNATIWKVSLNGTGDNPIRTECMANNHIRIGWDDYGAVISDETDWSKYDGVGKQILDAYINKMQIGDIVMSCYSSTTIDAIGVVTGEYKFDDSLPELKRVRDVKWLIKGIDENIVSINDNKTMVLGTVYRLNAITLDNVKSILEKYKSPTTMEVNNKPYVMVIDEINRGNVSKIFGELITLLEPDKRKGHMNEESVILPYSKTTFQIPDNVYIIATMNTADRSLAPLDYAIRRRFAFVAEKPYGLTNSGFNHKIFKLVSELFIENFDEYKDSDYDKDVKLSPAATLCDEYKPEDVWIGHSYFLMNDENGEDQTDKRIKYEIIPLLEEYIRDGVLTADAQAKIDDLYTIISE